MIFCYFSVDITYQLQRPEQIPFRIH